MVESYIYGELLLRCECGREESFEFHTLGWMFTVLEARDSGWRFDAAGKQAWCGKCGRKKFPMLYGKYPYHQALPGEGNASKRDSPRQVRRVARKTGKQTQKEVRKPRRI